MSTFILKRKLYAFINPAAVGSAIKNTGTAVMNVAKPLAVGTAVIGTAGGIYATKKAGDIITGQPLKEEG